MYVCFQPIMLNVYKRRKSTNTTLLSMVDIEKIDHVNDVDHTKTSKCSTANSKPKLQYIRGQRGNLLLLYKNFTYSKNNAKFNTIYWKCRSIYQGEQCNARITTVKRNNGLYDVFLTKAEHKHPPARLRKCLGKEEQRNQTKRAKRNKV